MEIQRQPSISSTLKILAKEFEEPRDDQTLVSGEISLKRKHSDCAFPSSMLSKRRFSNHSNMSKAAVGLRELAKKIGEAPLKWEGDKPKHVMIVSKPRDDSLTLVAADIASALAGMGLTV